MATKLGDFLQEKREELGLTVEELAVNMPIAASTIGQIERGEIRIPSIPVLEAFAENLDIALSTLLDLLPQGSEPNEMVSKNSMHHKETESRAHTPKYVVSASRDLPIVEGDWGNNPKKQLLDAFTEDGEIDTDVRRGFLVYDSANPQLREGYKLPFAAVQDGELVAVDAGLRAAASRLPQTDIPQDVADRARLVLDGYFEKMNEERKHHDDDDEEEKERLNQEDVGLVRSFLNWLKSLPDTPEFLEPETVKNQYLSTQKTRAVIVQRSDGRYLGFFNSANGVLLRNGTELDSSDLLRSFVEFEDENEDHQALVDVLHTNLRIGEVLGSAVEGYSLFDLVLFDDNPTARFFAETIRDNPGFWGVSPEYMPTEPATKEIVTVDGENREISIFNAGIRFYSSLVPESIAANQGTSTAMYQEKTNMANGIEELLKLAKANGASDSEIVDMQNRAEGTVENVAGMKTVKREDQLLAAIERNSKVLEDSLSALTQIAQRQNDDIQTVANLARENKEAIEALSQVKESEPIETEPTLTRGDLKAALNSTLSEALDPLVKALQQVTETVNETDLEKRTRAFEELPAQPVSMPHSARMNSGASGKPLTAMDLWQPAQFGGK